MRSGAKLGQMAQHMSGECLQVRRDGRQRHQTYRGRMPVLADGETRGGVHGGR